MSLTIVGIIPARYASTRFPAKALADIAGKTMIRRVYEQCLQATVLDYVVIATDDQRIYDHAQDFGATVVMTSPSHPSGTDRCHDAYQQLALEADFVINIQGDEPFISPKQIELLVHCLESSTEIATLVKIIEDYDQLFDPNTPKVLLDTQQEALYFSRQAVPYLRGINPENWLKTHTFYKHLGIYAYRTDILAKITELNPSALELAEALEQLRWLENGYRIKTAHTPYDSFGIDTPQDLQRALRQLKMKE